MERRAQLIKELQEAERELDAARKLSDVRLAAHRVQRAKAALKELDEAKPAGPRPRREKSQRSARRSGNSEDEFAGC
jgi:hypothetical protein